MNPLTAIFICIGILIFLCFTLRYDHDDKFNLWFMELVEQAPSYGFTSFEIEEWMEDDWIDYYGNGYSPEGALRQYLKDH